MDFVIKKYILGRCNRLEVTVTFMITLFIYFNEILHRYLNGASLLIKYYVKNTVFTYTLLIVIVTVLLLH